MDDEDIENELSNFDSRLDDVESSINKLERRDIKIEEYEIYFYSATIKKYLINLINYQNSLKFQCYPLSRNHFNKYFDHLNKFVIKNQSLNLDSIKYSTDNDLNQISQIIANQGRSGFSFLNMAERIIDINKPVLIFYGIEHLGAYFFNLHFNFTNSNQWENKIKWSKIRTIRNHGIGSGEFNNINRIEKDNFIDDLLQKKINLKKIGLCSRFFTVFNPNLRDHFYNMEKISFQDLLRNFFVLQTTDLIGNDYIPIPKEIRTKFKEHFGIKHSQIYLKSAVLTFYLLSFIFAYLSRYKMHIWSELLSSSEKNISYFVNFILKYGKEYFLKILFNRLKYYEKRGIIFIHQLGFSNLL